MTISGWIAFGILALIIGLIGIGIAVTVMDTRLGEALALSVTIILIVALLFGMLWYFKNTASGQRALTDQRSNLSNGLDRTINVYTADGGLIATYSGRIDIDTNDGGYVKFNFEGKRYIYYNCFVESIAEID